MKNRTGASEWHYLVLVWVPMAVAWLLVAPDKLLTAAPTTTSGTGERGRFLYIQSNNILEGQNSVIAYERLASGKLKPLLGSPFLTGGTGMNNNTHGKVGPHDNDTPILLSADGKRLFTVNTHSNTIAVFDIMGDRSLRHVKGSPFPSMGIGPNASPSRKMSLSLPTATETITSLRRCGVRRLRATHRFASIRMERSHFFRESK